MLTFNKEFKQPKEWKFDGKTLEEAEAKAQSFIDSYADKQNLFFYRSYQSEADNEAYIILKEKVAI